MHDRPEADGPNGWLTVVNPDFIAGVTGMEDGIGGVSTLLEAAYPVTWTVVDAVAPIHNAQTMTLAIC